jgi:hypothetical protein
MHDELMPVAFYLLHHYRYHPFAFARIAAGIFYFVFGGWLRTVILSNHLTKAKGVPNVHGHGDRLAR